MQQNSDYSAAGMGAAWTDAAITRVASAIFVQPSARHRSASALHNFGLVSGEGFALPWPLLYLLR
jgi:hypothetical protein